MTYYIETNVIAIIIAVIIMIQSYRTTSRNETSHIIFVWMLRALVVFSLSDIAAACSRGNSYLGVQASNIIYFICNALGVYLWFLYIYIKMKPVKNFRILGWISAIPVVLMSVAIILNPITGFFFTVDSANLYHRGTGVLLTWVVEWGYTIVAFIINFKSYIAAKSSYIRNEYRGYLYFAIPMALAAVCQMLFYGTTTVQIGFMMALLLAHLNKQHYQTMRDDLTGLNNKNAFLIYRDSIIHRSRESVITIIMIDLDRFKSINDTYGHLKGDQALKDVSGILKDTVESVGENRIALYRYAGDEFVMVGFDTSEEEIQSLSRKIDIKLAYMNQKNKAQGEGYSLALSFGYASGHCNDNKSLDGLIKAADDAMYNVKQSKKFLLH